VGVAVASGLSGLLITLAGINSEPGAVQTADAIWRLRYLNAFVPIIFIAISAVFGLMYPLNENKMKEIKAELEKRKLNQASCGNVSV